MGLGFQHWYWYFHWSGSFMDMGGRKGAPSLIRVGDGREGGKKQTVGRRDDLDTGKKRLIIIVAFLLQATLVSVR